MDNTRLLLMVGEAQHIPESMNKKTNSFLVGIIGLGGSSLINAGVFLKADEGTLHMSPWPSEIRDEPSILDECELYIYAHDRGHSIT
jgi:hypothetical protein